MKTCRIHFYLTVSNQRLVQWKICKGLKGGKRILKLSFFHLYWDVSFSPNDGMHSTSVKNCAISPSRNQINWAYAQWQHRLRLLLALLWVFSFFFSLSPWRFGFVAIFVRCAPVFSLVLLPSTWTGQDLSLHAPGSSSVKLPKAPHRPWDAV